jgi:hypothetical protein
MLPVFTSIAVREVQAEKAKSPIFVTVLGMETEVREMHQKNAPSPMDATLLGIVTEVSKEQ